MQKTEESLRRLRNLKEKTGAVTNQQNSIGPTMSDDDKIRLQLQIDVMTWTSELSNLNFLPCQIVKLVELNKIIENILKSKEDRS